MEDMGSNQPSGEPMTQSEMIYEHLSKGGTLTVAEALSWFGCYALSQRIGELKRDGVPVESEMVKLANGKRVARYKLGSFNYG